MIEPSVDSALGLAQQVARGALAPTALVSRCIEAVDRHDGALASFVELDPRAVENAERLAAGPRRSRLHGLPIAIKDNICTSGLRTSCGSAMLESYIPPYDATAACKLRSAGLILLGKTNLDELAMGSSTEWSAFGPTRNPWDLNRVPGGSSGGSAAAVAAGLVPLALGSDTGGSVRQPAAFCGIVGLKPTYGCVSRYGLVAFASCLDQIGCLASRVDDAAALLEIIAGEDEHDATAGCPPGWSVSCQNGAAADGETGPRVAVPRQVWGGLEPECREAFTRALALLEGLGCVISEVELEELELAAPTYAALSSAEAATNLARFDGMRFGRRVSAPGRSDDGSPGLRETVEASRDRGLGAEVKRRLLLGTFVLAAGYRESFYGRAMAARQRLTRAISEMLEHHELIATPTAPGPAFRLGERVDDPIAMYGSDVFTVLANLVGAPAISVPMRPAPVEPEIVQAPERPDPEPEGCEAPLAGLPLGLQLMAGPWQEGPLIHLARRFEQARGELPGPPRLPMRQRSAPRSRRPGGTGE